MAREYDATADALSTVPTAFVNLILPETDVLPVCIVTEVAVVAVIVGLGQGEDPDDHQSDERDPGAERPAEHRPGGDARQLRPPDRADRQRGLRQRPGDPLGDEVGDRRGGQPAEGDRERHWNGERWTTTRTIKEPVEAINLAEERLSPEEAQAILEQNDVPEGPVDDGR